MLLENCSHYDLYDNIIYTGVKWLQLFSFVHCDITVMKVTVTKVNEVEIVKHTKFISTYNVSCETFI